MCQKQNTIYYSYIFKKILYENEYILCIYIIYKHYLCQLGEILTDTSFVRYHVKYIFCICRKMVFLQIYPNA